MIGYERFLSRDLKVSYDHPTQRVILENPIEVIWDRKEAVKRRLFCSFGKFELEEFIVERLFELVSNSNTITTDISEFSGICVHWYSKDKETITKPKDFLKKVIHLPIFEIVKEDEKKITLKFLH